MESFNNSIIKSYQGKAQAVIRPFLTSGEIKISAESKGLNTGEVNIATY